MTASTPMMLKPTNLPPAPAAPSTRTPDEGKSILSTLNDDGTRRWLKPRLSPGRFLTRRRIVAYALIALFVSLPWITINHKPAVLINLITRRFTFFGRTFLPSDTLLSALLLVSVFLTIFWITALLGRAWCGWACPQTVYMEFVFRPLERLFQGAPGRAKKGWLQTSGAGSVLKYPVYFVISFALAHTFLSYFVGVDNLRHWIFGSPFDHIAGFGVVVVVTGLMMFDFSFFREQVCLVACPYGRIQSVMLDRQSITVRYDATRGEPRGKGTNAHLALPVLNGLTPTAAKGDCVDCSMCVTTCPTGIDIRKGVQMECVGCAQCIDACDAVMTKLSRPTGLIRYASEASLHGERVRMLRPRVILYPSIIAVLLAAFVTILFTTPDASVTVLRGLGKPFAELPDGRILNTARVKVVNRSERAITLTIEPDGFPGATLDAGAQSFVVPAGQMVTTPVQITVPTQAFAAGQHSISLRVRELEAAPAGAHPVAVTRSFTLMGPGQFTHH